MKMADTGQFVTAVSASLSTDGDVAQLQFRRANGKIAYIDFPTAAAGPMMLNIEQAMGTLFEMQRARVHGEDPRGVFAIGAKKVAKIQGAISVDGQPVLSLLLESKMRLDFALPQGALRELIEWLEELEAAQKLPRGLKH
jgi:hypothetical protein